MKAFGPIAGCGLKFLNTTRSVEKKSHEFDTSLCKVWVVLDRLRQTEIDRTTFRVDSVGLLSNLTEIRHTIVEMKCRPPHVLLKDIIRISFYI
jgi:hypothetical protein